MPEITFYGSQSAILIGILTTKCHSKALDFDGVANWSGRPVSFHIAYCRGIYLRVFKRCAYTGSLSLSTRSGEATLKPSIVIHSYTFYYSVNIVPIISCFFEIFKKNNGCT